MGEVVQLEIFTVSAVDPPWRDNKDAMEYPVSGPAKETDEADIVQFQRNSFKH